MYSIYRTKQYKKAYKKLHKFGASEKLFDEIDCVIDMLAQGESLELNYRDHQLKGEMHQYRGCHIRGDLLLVYEKREEVLILVLINIGSHAQIFE